MDWMYLVYFLLALLMAFGAKGCARGEWNVEYTSLGQTRNLLGITALGVILHHMAQKTCAPWLPVGVRVNGLNFFLDLGFLFVGTFLFCSGLGLYRSLHARPDYLKGFLRRRILWIVTAFYLSEWIYTAVRLLMGEKMNPLHVLWYLSGLHLANQYAWYVAAIPFFYLAFWAAFRFCKREGTAIFLVFAFTLAYTVTGALIDHQNDWWMRGEWWYNSILLFPLGLLFGRYEKQLTSFFRKGYWFWLLLSVAALVLLFRQSDYLVNSRWGYHGEGTALKVPHRLMSAGMQWLVCIAYVASCFLLMMKVKTGNRALAWLGGMTLELYLTHGLFVELFGYSFFDVAASAFRIKKVPLYIAAVLGCTIPAAMGFRWLCRKAYGLLAGRGRKRESPQPGERDAGQVPEKIRRLQAKYQAEASSARVMKIVRNGFFPLLFLLMFAGILILSNRDSTCVAGGMRIVPPAGYSQVFSDSRYVKWKYSGEGKKPGEMILDREIKGDYSQQFASAEDVLAQCAWLTDAELYVNPQGIRMARGFSTEYSGYPERRYYVESDGAVFLISMIEDSRYYDPADCEDAMQQTADSIRRR